MGPASSSESPAATDSSNSYLTGILADVPDRATWVPANADEAGQAIDSVAAYCRDYCPVRLQCAEEACWLYQLEERADAVIAHSPSERVGVLGQPITAL